MKTTIRYVRHAPQHRRPVMSVVWVLAIALVSGCAHDLYRERTDAIKDHVKAFYANLEADRVQAAVHHNEQIEAIGTEMGDRIRRRAHQPGTNEVDRDAALARSAYDAAARNWLALARYLTVKEQYGQARSTYQRVVDTYSAQPFQVYAEQAARGLKDLSMLAPAPRP
jgi:hypothetical protein